MATGEHERGRCAYAAARDRKRRRFLDRNGEPYIGYSRERERGSYFLGKAERIRERKWKRSSKEAKSQHRVIT